ncbi:MAG: protein phosphatase 2C domain-containing protein [Verrucomicrobiales bacterium]
MIEEKDTQRATVHIGFDGRVHKVFRGPEAEERFANEVKVLRYLEQRGCDFVPRLLDADPEKLKIVTSNCGSRVEQMGESRMKALFGELEAFGVRHDDPFLRNVTYRATDGRFCVIDFEFATFLDPAMAEGGAGDDSAPEGEPLAWSCRTDVGKVRANNEDSFLALALDSEGVKYLGDQGVASLADNDLILAVSDGMAARGGESSPARSRSKRSRGCCRANFAAAWRTKGADIKILTELFIAIHAELNMLGQNYAECQGMGTTLSLAWFTPGRMAIAHIGDSRIYRSTEGGDHSQPRTTRLLWLAAALRNQRGEARNHPRRNVLNRVLGAGHQHAEPQITAVEIAPGDRILLCTDGVTDALWDRTLAQQLRDRDRDREEKGFARVIVDRSVASTATIRPRSWWRSAPTIWAKNKGSPPENG